MAFQSSPSTGSSPSIKYRILGLDGGSFLQRIYSSNISTRTHNSHRRGAHIGVMLDTSKIAWIVAKHSTTDALSAAGWRPLFDPQTGQRTWCYKEGKGSRYPYLHVFSAPDGINYVSATVSIPGLVFGSNVQLPDEVQAQQALDDLTAYVGGKIGAELDPDEAIVWNIHFARNLNGLEEDVFAKISSASNMIIPGYDRGSYRYSTLYYHSKGVGKEGGKPRTICIYGKHADCIRKRFPQSDIQRAEGVLRLESRFKTPDAVQRLVKALPGERRSRKARALFRQDVSDFVLDPIEKLLLNCWRESVVDNSLKTLAAKYGRRRSYTLIAFLVYLHQFGDDFYKLGELGFSRSTYYGCLRDCRKAGIYSLFGVRIVNGFHEEVSE